MPIDHKRCQLQASVWGHEVMGLWMQVGGLHALGFQASSLDACNSSALSQVCFPECLQHPQLTGNHPHVTNPREDLPSPLGNGSAATCFTADLVLPGSQDSVVLPWFMQTLLCSWLALKVAVSCSLPAEMKASVTLEGKWYGEWGNNQCYGTWEPLRFTWPWSCCGVDYVDVEQCMRQVGAGG